MLFMQTVLGSVIFSGVCFIGGFYVGMALMAIMAAGKEADKQCEDYAREAKDTVQSSQY